MYKAILFDLDGTLTESGPGIMKSVQYALEKIGHPEENLEALRSFVGPPLKEQFMKYAGVDEDTAKEAIQYYRQRYEAVGMYENALYPGIPELLEFLCERGYLLAVASSKPEKYVKEILKFFDITGYFTAVVGAQMNETRTRKSEVVEEALYRLGLEGQGDQAILIGDKEHDVFGAREAGVECLAVTYGYGTLEELAAADPLRIAQNTEEIADFFQ